MSKATDQDVKQSLDNDDNSRKNDRSMTPTPSKRIKKENVPYTDTTLSDRKKKSPAKKKGKKKMLAITSSSSVVPAKKGGKVKVSLLTGKPVGKSKVRKEADIKAEIEFISARREKLVAQKEKLEKTIEASIKFPVRDEDITRIDVKGKRPLPLPLATNKLSVTDDIASDALMVWDVLHMFSAQLRLFPTDIDDFMDLLNFTGRPSIALTELCCALLKVILSDERLASKIANSIPKSINFSYRNRTGTPVDIAPGKDLVDLGYNGLSLLPLRLKQELINPLNWQTVLRCILLRLPPSKHLREAAGVLATGKEVIQGIASPTRKLPLSFGERDKASARARKNVDILYRITSDPHAAFEVLQAAAVELQNKEFHELSAQHKISLLKILVESCYETVLFRTVVDTNNEERCERISKLKAAARDELMKRKEVSNTKRNQAIEACRQINIATMGMEASEEKCGKGPATVPDEALPDLCHMILEGGVGSIGSIAQRLMDKYPQVSKRQADLKLNELGIKERRPGDQRSIWHLRPEFEYIKDLTPAQMKTKSVADEKKKKRSKAVENDKEEKKKKKDIDPYFPKPDQLQAMLDEMVTLDILGLDGIEELEEIEATDTATTSDEIPMELLDMKEKILRRRQAADKKKIETANGVSKYDREQLRRLRLDAINLMEQALQTKMEKDVKIALKVAKQAGFRWINEKGQDVCIDLLKRVYRVQLDLEQAAKDAATSRQHEKDLAEYFVRCQQLGTDRHHARYFCFDGDLRLFVEKLEPLSSGSLMNSSTSFVDFSAALEGVKPIEFAVPHATVGSSDITSRATSRLIKSRPSALCSKWSIYASQTDMYKLCEALDERGEREQALKTALKARFEIKEPVQDYNSSGHDYIGKKVLRKFGKSKKTTYGTIVGWLPADGGDPAIWHVEHRDGDEEDLEEHELGTIYDEQPDMSQEEPSVVEAYTNKIRGVRPVISAQIGIEGLRSEILRHQVMILDGLKKKGVKIDKFYPRDVRRIWEQSVKTAEEVPELRRALQSLEEVTHCTQELPDIMDEEEARKIKQEYRDNMLVDGWKFSDDPHGLVGVRFRRYFRGHGKSDGTIVAYLSDKKSEDGQEWYYLEHDDGDQEDVTILTATKAAKYYSDGAAEFDYEDLIGKEDDDEEDDDNDGIHLDDDQEVEVEEQIEDDDGVGSERLWPSHDVRMRWLHHLQASKTISEIALALAAFIDHAKAFDALGPDPLDLLGHNNSAGLWGRTGREKSVQKRQAGPNVLLSSKRANTRQR